MKTAREYINFLDKHQKIQKNSLKDRSYYIQYPLTVNYNNTREIVDKGFDVSPRKYHGTVERYVFKNIMGIENHKGLINGGNHPFTTYRDKYLIYCEPSVLDPNGANEMCRLEKKMRRCSDKDKPRECDFIDNTIRHNAHQKKYFGKLFRRLSKKRLQRLSKRRSYRRLHRRIRRLSKKISTRKKR